MVLILINKFIFATNSGSADVLNAILMNVKKVEVSSS